MNRRDLIAGLVVALGATTTSSVSAQDATPEDDDELYISDLANLRGVKKGVFQYAEAPHLSFADALAGHLFFLDTWGFSFDSESNAEHAPYAMAEAYQRWARVSEGRQFSVLKKASARTLGEESWGYVAEMSTSEDVERVFPWAQLAVRKGTTVQILTGVSGSGTPLRRLADISEKTLDRWPNTKPRSTYDGEPTGGIWDTLPRLADLEEGMVIDDSFDVTSVF